jgi:hypothetical protein
MTTTTAKIRPAIDQDDTKAVEELSRRVGHVPLEVTNTTQGAVDVVTVKTAPAIVRASKAVADFVTRVTRLENR